jgi:phosphomannomutase
VTASHNPPADNGYKVYLGDGAQLVPPHDERIAAAIEAVAGHDKGRVRVADPPPALPPDEVVDAYLAATVGALASPAHRDVRVAYTPLSGVGLDVARRAFERAGFPPLDVVTSQAQPDPNFGGLAFPNPEEPGVLDAVLALARESGADVALANDPDADRLGVAVPDPDRGGWRPLSGNEIGALLADHLLRHSAGADRLVVASLVSSRLVERLARAAGVHFEATLTGFKWIVRPALAHPEWRFVFGYEEALGFSVSPVVRDKDGIAAALAFAELTAELRAQGSSPVARLVELARAHGLHATRQWSIRFADRHQSLHQASELMERVRRGPPPLLGGQRLATIRDLLAPGSHLPPTDAVLWDLDDGSRIVFRPSGTEPKLKVYLEVVRPVPAGDRTGEAVRQEADGALDTLQGELASLLEVPRWADETGHGSRG